MFLSGTSALIVTSDASRRCPLRLGVLIGDRHSSRSVASTMESSRSAGTTCGDVGSSAVKKEVELVVWLKGRSSSSRKGLSKRSSCLVCCGGVNGRCVSCGGAVTERRLSVNKGRGTRLGDNASSTGSSLTSSWSLLAPDTHESASLPDSLGGGMGDSVRDVLAGLIDRPSLAATMRLTLDEPISTLVRLYRSLCSRSSGSQDLLNTHFLAFSCGRVLCLRTGVGGPSSSISSVPVTKGDGTCSYCRI